MSEYIQEIINQIKDFINIEFGFCDETGTIIGCSIPSKVGKIDTNIPQVLESNEDVCLINDYVYQKYYRNSALDFIVFINNPNQDAINYIQAISICIINLRNLTESYISKSNLIKNIINGTISSGEILLRAKELHLPQNAKRIVYLIRTEKSNKTQVIEIIQGIFPDRNKDFVIGLDDQNIVLVKELNSEENDPKTIEKIATLLVEAINSEIMIKAYVGIGTPFNSLTELPRSFKEAQTALSIGEIFYSNKYVINYNNLGLGRLVFQLPKDLCELFLKEVFKGRPEDTLDEETLLTINKLFENNLHISEAARQLYMHRNTLVYRLEKIQKTIGLDLKKFEDALLFKIGLLINEYLKKTSEKETTHIDNN